MHIDLSPKEAIKQELQLRALCKKDFNTFLYTKWERYDRKHFAHNWHFEFLSEALSCTIPKYAKENNFKLETRLILNMPPSYGKTETIARSFIAWALGNDNTRKFMYISYSDELCKRISAEVRDLLKSSFFKNIFGAQRFLQDNSSDFILQGGGGCFFTTLKSAITGFHAHTILIDDPIKVSEMHSKSARDSVNLNFSGSVLSRLKDNDSSVIILMQRLGDEDLCGYLLNPKNFEARVREAWNILKLQAINTEQETYKIGRFTKVRPAKEPLFPARHNLEQLEFLRLQMGEDEFQTQYQQEPQATEAGFFLKEYYKNIPYYEIGDFNAYIFVDNAQSINASSDNRAIGVIAVDLKEDLERYTLLDLSFGIWSEEETIAQIIALGIEYRSAKIYIEKEGGGETLTRLLEKEIVRLNTELKQKGKEIFSNTIVAYNASRKISKVEKIKAMRSYYNTGFLCVKIGAKGEAQFKKELFAFNPEKPFRKDDCIDVVASCIQHIDTKAPKRIKNKNPLPKRHTTTQSWWRI